MALSNIAQILGKKKRAPGSVRPGLDTQQKNRENLDQIDIKQPKLRWACWQRQKQKSIYSRIQTKLLWNKVSMNNILRHFQEKKNCTDFGYLLLEDTLFKTKPHMFLLLLKSLSQYLVKVCKEPSKYYLHVFDLQLSHSGSGLRHKAIKPYLAHSDLAEIPCKKKGCTSWPTDLAQIPSKKRENLAQKDIKQRKLRWASWRWKSWKYKLARYFTLQ